MRLVFGFALALLSSLTLFACKKNRDEELKTALDELAKLDDAIEETVKGKPNEEGLAAAESLLGAKRASLHDRLATFDVAQISPEAGMALSNACVRNGSAARNVLDYVRNAVLKTNPDLVARASRVAGDLCNVCPDAPVCSGLAAP